MFISTGSKKKTKLFNNRGNLDGREVNFCKDHRDKTEVPDPLAV